VYRRIGQGKWIKKWEEEANEKMQEKELMTERKKNLRQNSQMMKVRGKETLGMVVLERAITLLVCILMRRFSPSL
jgi:hypothetical protein